MSTFYILNDVYISHHGIKGMRWGIRRYQNKDSDTLLVQAVPEGINIEDFYGGFFLINKKNGEWRSCSPIDFL